MSPSTLLALVFAASTSAMFPDHYNFKTFTHAFRTVGQKAVSRLSPLYKHEKEAVSVVLKAVDLYGTKEAYTESELADAAIYLACNPLIKYTLKEQNIAQISTVPNLLKTMLMNLGKDPAFLFMDVGSGRVPLDNLLSCDTTVMSAVVADILDVIQPYKVFAYTARLTKRKGAKGWWSTVNRTFLQMFGPKGTTPIRVDWGGAPMVTAKVLALSDADLWRKWLGVFGAVGATPAHLVNTMHSRSSTIIPGLLLKSAYTGVKKVAKSFPLPPDVNLRELDQDRRDTFENMERDSSIDNSMVSVVYESHRRDAYDLKSYATEMWCTWLMTEAIGDTTTEEIANAIVDLESLGYDGKSTAISYALLVAARLNAASQLQGNDVAKLAIERLMELCCDPQSQARYNHTLLIAIAIAFEKKVFEHVSVPETVANASGASLVAYTTYGDIYVKTREIFCMIAKAPTDFYKAPVVACALHALYQTRPGHMIDPKVALIVCDAVQSDNRDLGDDAHGNHVPMVRSMLRWGIAADVWGNDSDRLGIAGNDIAKNAATIASWVAAAKKVMDGSHVDSVVDLLVAKFGKKLSAAQLKYHKEDSTVIKQSPELYAGSYTLTNVLPREYLFDLSHLNEWQDGFLKPLKHPLLFPFAMLSISVLMIAVAVVTWMLCVRKRFPSS